MRRNPYVIKDKEEILDYNVKFLIERFFKSGDPFYIKCNPYAIKTIGKVDYNIYDKILQDLQDTTYTNGELLEKLKGDTNQKLIAYREKLLTNRGITLKDNVNLKNYARQILPEDIKEINGINLTDETNTDLGVYSDYLDQNINNPFNEIAAKELNKLQNPNEIKKMAKHLIANFKLTDKYKQYKHYNIAYKYYKDNGIKIEIPEKYKIFKYCSIVLTLKEKDFFNLPKLNCDNNEKILLTKWANYCGENESKLDDKSPKFLQLLCSDTMDKNLQSSDVKYDQSIKKKTIKTLEDKCSTMETGGRKTRSKKHRTKKRQTKKRLTKKRQTKKRQTKKQQTKKHRSKKRQTKKHRSKKRASPFRTP